MTVVDLSIPETDNNELVAGNSGTFKIYEPLNFPYVLSRERFYVQAIAAEVINRYIIVKGGKNDLCLTFSATQITENFYTTGLKTRRSATLQSLTG